MRCWLVFEDRGGVPLQALLASHRADLDFFFKVAIQLAAILSKLHRQDIIHRNLNPRSVVFNQAAGETRLTDFSFACGPASESHWFLPQRLSSEALPRQERRASLPERVGMKQEASQRAASRGDAAISRRRHCCGNRRRFFLRSRSPSGGGHRCPIRICYRVHGSNQNQSAYAGLLERRIVGRQYRIRPGADAVRAESSKEK